MFVRIILLPNPGTRWSMWSWTWDRWRNFFLQLRYLSVRALHLFRYFFKKSHMQLCVTSVTSTFHVSWLKWIFGMSQDILII